MTIQAQNRLIGALVLISLGVIFLPDLLENHNKVASEEQIMLQIDTIELQNESDAVEQAVVAQGAKEKIDEKRAEQKQAEKIIEAKPNFVKNAWILQLGVFRHPSNARSLANKLHGAGYTAQVQAMTMKNGSVMSRVYVGPDVSKDNINQQREKIAQLTGISGQIMAFNALGDLDSD